MISYMPLMRTLDEKGMTLIDLAKKMGMSNTSIRSPMDKGEYLRISTLMNIAETLQCGIEDLIEWKEGEGIESSSKYIRIDWDKFTEIRQKAGYSARKLSEAAGLKTTFLESAKNEKRKMAPVDIEKFCKILGVEKEDFIQ